MALRLSNTGTRDQMFTDYQTVMGTTMGWTLFDNVDADHKVYTLPADGGQGPAYIELERNTSTHTIYLRIWQSWDAGTSTGTGDAPNVVDAVSTNGFDFTSDAETKSYRIFAGNRYLAGTLEGVGTSITGMWAGLVTTLATAAQYVVPVGLVACQGNATSYKAYWRSDAGVGWSATVLDPFDIGGFTSTTESNSGKTPVCAIWLFSTGANRNIPGTCDDVLMVPAGMSFDDILTLSGNSYRTAGGGIFTFLV